MKPNPVSALISTIAIVAALCGSGCSSTSDKSSSQSNVSEAAPAKAGTVPALPAGVSLHKDKDIQGVWLAPGFNFKGYDTLYVSDTAYHAVERANEDQMRAMAVAAVKDQIVQTARASSLFKTVTTRAEDIQPGSKGLKMMNSIIEYEKGGGGARYFAGVYGAGQPVVKVRGMVYDGDKLVCVYEIRRSGEGGSARMFGGYRGDDSIQRRDIEDLANDLADFMKRTANSK